MMCRPISRRTIAAKSNRVAIGGAALAAFLVLISAQPLCADELAERLATLGKMVDAGDSEKGLADAKVLRETWPAMERLTAWELDFHGEVVRAVPGERHLYYQLLVPNTEPMAPGRREALASVNANHD